MTEHSKLLDIIIIAAVCIVFESFASAGTNDTPESVMNAAKQGSVEAGDIFTAVNEANSFLNRLSSDRAYAAKLLEAVQKKDPAGVVAVVKQTAPRSQISVEQMKPDFLVILGFKVKVRNVIVCVSTQNSCLGRAAAVDVK